MGLWVRWAQKNYALATKDIWLGSKKCSAWVGLTGLKGMNCLWQICWLEGVIGCNGFAGLKECASNNGFARCTSKISPQQQIWRLENGGGENFFLAWVLGVSLQWRWQYTVLPPVDHSSVLLWMTSKWRCNEWEPCGKYDTIVLTKIEQQRKKKKKYTMALNGHRQINFHATTNQK